MSHRALALISQSSERAENIKTFSINKASKTSRSATVYGRLKEVSQKASIVLKAFRFIFSFFNASKRTLQCYMFFFHHSSFSIILIPKLSILLLSQNMYESKQVLKLQKNCNGKTFSRLLLFARARLFFFLFFTFSKLHLCDFSCVKKFTVY